MNVSSSVTHRKFGTGKLRKNRELGYKFARIAVESLTDVNTRPVGLLMLRALAEAYGGLGAVAAKAGVSRESLYRSLSPKGNPTLKTLVAVLNTMGLSLSVVPQSKPVRKRTAKKRTAVKSTKAARAAA